MADPFVSVIIPVLERYEALGGCLRALAGQSYPPDRIEILVVDNGRIPRAEEALGGGRGPVRFLHEPVKGSYRARNRGLREARGSIYAFTDSDCIPDRDWIRRLSVNLMGAQP